MIFFNINHLYIYCENLFIHKLFIPFIHFVHSLLVEEYCSLRNERSNDEDIVNELHEHMKVFTAALERR